MANRWVRARARLRRAAGRVTRVGLAKRLLSIAICIFAGFMIATGAVNARGSDLRPNRNTDLAGLIASESRRNGQLAERVVALREEVDALAHDDTGGITEERLAAAAEVAGQTPVKGPAVTVALDDAPDEVAPPGVDADLLVVHQQDIQAVVNALWSGGAEAMTIQGQRVTSRTGVKCVGNSVVLHGVPYAPPYRIVAIGDQGRLEAALASSASLQVYRQYVQAYRLGYEQGRLSEAAVPAYRGSLEISAKRPG